MDMAAVDKMGCECDELTRQEGSKLTRSFKKGMYKQAQMNKMGDLTRHCWHGKFVV